MTHPVWRVFTRRIVFLLVIWFLAGPVLGVLVVDRVNGISIGGLPLGFWIAQQGSIVVFVVLIFVSAWLTDRDAGMAGTGERAAPESDGER
ncbi:MAG: DUF4212 domain-containing protein [Gemmatimonadetes bacterium]|nr:DUF4212 domain-containing protein [Gemmatimonadota bacterium]